ncbi:alkaline phosphatase family protein [Terrilactibacillus sp. S3-3]|nr:alkaline phosphatase family protein [Terrilactibacillus sp. S3-3]
MYRLTPRKKWTAAIAAAMLTATGSIFALPSAQTLTAKAAGHLSPVYSNKADRSKKTTTPIKHVVVIFQENVSFDHYFATYPNAQNPKGEPPFHAKANTPTVNGLSASLLTNNPNEANPQQRLDRSQAVTADMDHDYTAEQEAFNGGQMNRFVKYGGRDSDVVMNYYDGNTVTGLWNIAQHFALNDNSFGTTYGPSTPGALNLVSGQTHGAMPYTANDDKNGQLISGGALSGKIDNGTLHSDIDPYFDKTSSGKTAKMTGTNVGDLLNKKAITWGWFEGGFRNSGEQHKKCSRQCIDRLYPASRAFSILQVNSES